MTPRTGLPPKPCDGQFRADCVECGVRTHPGHRDRRACDEGHRAYIGKGRCSRCFLRAYRLAKLPTVNLVRHGNRKPRAKTITAVPVPAVGWIDSPCSRCGKIARLPFGPGDALCDPCGGAEQIDILEGMLERGDVYALAGTA